METKVIKEIGALNNKKISIIFPCFGRYEMVEPYVYEIFNTLLLLKDNINLIVVTDGSHWENTPLIQIQKVLFPDICMVSVIPESSLPAVLYNVGLKKVNTPYVHFVWPGCGIDKQDLEQFINKTNMDPSNPKVYSLDNCILKEFPFQTAIYVVRHGWCQCAKIYELNNLLINAAVFQEIGLFDSSRIIQRDFDWEFLVRLTRNYNFINIGASKGKRLWGFDEFPYNRHFNVSKDISHRYILRRKQNIKIQDTDIFSNDEMDFLVDLPINERAYVIRATKSEENRNNDAEQVSSDSEANFNYKLTIISNYWDFPHNQICFFNYLDKLYGQKFATYKVLLDSTASVKDIQESDLVIFSRCRNSKILDLISYCNDKQIATLYMLDDNWFCVAKDWPEHYGKIFVAGNPEFDAFREAITKCSAMLVYNKYLEEDAKQYARKVIRIPTNIDLDLFKPFFESKPDNDREIKIGFSGSLRYDNQAFNALAEIAAVNPQVKVIIFGHITAEQEELFKNISHLKIDYNMYFEYYKQFMKLRPSILLAPLEESRSSISKCPNKYLEIAAIGSVGIYSNTYPYNEVIQDGINGFLVANLKDSWKQKINDLLKNPEILETVRQNSMNDLKLNYITEVVMPQFCEAIHSIIRGEKA